MNYDERDLEIQPTYDWAVRAFAAVKDRLGLSVKFHHNEGQLEKGQIFLFNHFARFETIIPQFVIYEETGAYCRCVASSELFRINERFSKFLFGLGAVPNDLPRLMPFLAAEILRGRKLIAFPEGRMVKDRKVMDEDGEFSIYSPKTKKRREHHSGAAVIAATLEIFKKRIQYVYEAGEEARLERWIKALRLKDLETLLEAVRRPTVVVPANITFYPIRAGENILTRAYELFGEKLSGRALEEMIIEGNMLFQNTDMDVRFGKSIEPTKKWRWWERRLLDRIFKKIHSLDQLFSIKDDSEHLDIRLVFMLNCFEVRRIRDESVRGMYAATTINIAHLISTIIYMFVEEGRTEVDENLFHKILYVAIKNVQAESGIYLHHGLQNPEVYNWADVDGSAGFGQFMTPKACSELIVRKDGKYRFLPKLQKEYTFHETRLENLIVVYANEMAPVASAVDAVKQALNRAPGFDDRSWAKLLFDDEMVSHSWNKNKFSKPEYEEINARETATACPEPYLLLPTRPHRIGIVLTHGFAASPAELRAFGEKLQALNYPVIGVRLAGHGTSPWDLRDRSWEDWLDSVRRGYRIMSAFAERVCLIGFSSGGDLSLLLAAEKPERLAGVVAVAPPVTFQNKNMSYVPFVHGLNRVTNWISSFDGVKSFRKNPSEHPHINYQHMPIRGLYELHLMVETLQEKLAAITCPVAVLQGIDDPVVKPESARIIIDGLGSERKSLYTIDSKRHGIVNEDIGETHETIIAFVESLS